MANLTQIDDDVERRAFAARSETLAGCLVALMARIDSLAAAHRAALRMLRVCPGDKDAITDPEIEPSDGVDALRQYALEVALRLNNEVVRANLLCERLQSLGIDELPVYQDPGKALFGCVQAGGERSVGHGRRG